MHLATLSLKSLHSIEDGGTIHRKGLELRPVILKKPDKSGYYHLDKMRIYMIEINEDIKIPTNRCAYILPTPEMNQLGVEISSGIFYPGDIIRLVARSWTNGRVAENIPIAKICISPVEGDRSATPPEPEKEE